MKFMLWTMERINYGGGAAPFADRPVLFCPTRLAPVSSAPIQGPIFSSSAPAETDVFTNGQWRAGHDFCSGGRLSTCVKTINATKGFRSTGRACCKVTKVNLRVHQQFIAARFRLRGGHVQMSFRWLKTLSRFSTAVLSRISVTRAYNEARQRFQKKTTD
jgi:hypothetical protein